MITGDETGLLKVVTPLGDKSKTYGFGNQNRSQGVQSLFRVSNDDLFSVVRKNGVVEYWKANCDDEVNLGLLHTQQLKLDCVDGGSGVKNFRTIVYNSDGCVNIVMPKFDEEISDNIHESKLEGNISALASDQENMITYGGKENDIKLVDLNTMQQTWAAKNVPNDNLNLRVPIWLKALQLSKAEEDGAHMITAGTAYRHIRLYDTRTNQRPIQSILTEEEYSITALLNINKCGLLFASNGAGNLFQYDMRMGKRMLTLKSCRGSIRALELVNDGKLLAAAGLDRYLHIYNCKSGKFKEKYYLKNRITTILSVKANCIKLESDTENNENDSSDIEIEDDLQEYNDSDNEGSIDSEVEEELLESDRAKQPKRRK